MHAPLSLTVLLRATHPQRFDSPRHGESHNEKKLDVKKNGIAKVKPLRYGMSYFINVT